MGAEDDKAKKLVLDILGDRTIKEINFGLSDTTISSTMYGQVSQAIADRKITVLVEPKLLAKEMSGRYFPVVTIAPDNEWYNVLILRDSGRGTSMNEQFDRAQTIVHECTHAGLDLLKVPDMTHTEEEACAYVADGIFAMAKMLALKGDPSKVIITEPIRRAAWEVARLQIQSKAGATGMSAAYWVSPDFAVRWWDAVSTLYVTIRNSPTYAAAADDKIIHDGVGREWKLPKSP